MLEMGWGGGWDEGESRSVSMGCDEGFRARGPQGKKRRLEMRCCSVFWYSDSHFRPLRVQAKVNA